MLNDFLYSCESSTISQLEKKLCLKINQLRHLQHHARNFFLYYCFHLYTHHEYIVDSVAIIWPNHIGHLLSLFFNNNPEEKLHLIKS